MTVGSICGPVGEDSGVGGGGGGGAPRPVSLLLIFIYKASPVSRLSGFRVGRAMGAASDPVGLYCLKR